MKPTNNVGRALLSLGHNPVAPVPKPEKLRTAEQIDYFQAAIYLERYANVADVAQGGIRISTRGASKDGRNARRIANVLREKART